MHRTRAAGPGAQCRADFAHDVLRGVIVDRMDRIQAQTIKAKLFHPVQRVMDKEVPHRARVDPIKVDGRAPRRLVRRVEELRAVGVQVVAFWPEMVVNHVQQHHQPEPMGGINQCLERVRCAV